MNNGITIKEINNWIAKAKKEGYKYIISVCDTFDYSDYPVYCRDVDELSEEFEKYNNVNMQRINEVITIE